MSCSLLIPTRGRIQELSLLLNSISVSIQSRKHLEILLRVDDDDHIPYERLYSDHWPWIRPIRSPRGKGYQDVQSFYTELSDRATGDWLFLLNDDAIIIGHGWDKQLAELTGQKLLVEPEIQLYRNKPHDYVDHSPFPIIPRDSWKIGGAKQIPVDADLYRLLLPQGYKVHKMPGITFCHNRGTDEEIDREHQS